MSNDNENSAEDWVPIAPSIPSHWAYADFEHAFEPVSTSKIKIPEAQYATSGTFPVIDQGKNFIGGFTDAENCVINKDGFAIVFGDHTRCFKLINFPFAPGADGTKVLKVIRCLDPKFAYYGCLSLRLPDRGYSRHYSFLKRTRFPVAPLNEQRRIVAKIEELFSELDKGVESLTTAREQLKAYRQSVLKHAFAGKLTEDWRKEHPEKLRTAEEILKDVLNARTDKTGRPFAEADLPDFQNLSPLPRGWTYLPFEAVACSIRNGISKKPNETGALKIFRISAVRPMEFDMVDFRHIDDEPEFHRFMLRRGDVVFTRYNGSRAYVGVAAVFHSDEAFVYPDKLIRCEVQSPHIDPGYIEKAVNCGESRAFIESRIRTTAGQAGISGGDLKAMPVPICSIEEQKEINERVETQLSAIARLESELEIRLSQAGALRQSILKRAFSGQLVAQDPADELASVLLERVRPGREERGAKKRRTKSVNKEAA